jgi:drug/metabolite transporter (DMT)-like permease
MRQTAERYVKFIVVLAVISGSTSGILGRLITADSMAIGFYRLTLALPFFLVPVLLRKREALKSVPTRDLIWSGISGIFLFWHFLCWFIAVKNTTIASAIILADLHPLIVMGITVVILKKKIPFRAAMGVFVALLGAGLVVGFDYSIVDAHLYGDVMALFTAVAMGIYFCIGGVLRKDIPGDIYITLVFTVCWICFTIGMFVTRTPFWGYPLSDYLWLIVMTVLCQIGAHAVMNWSLRFVPSLYVSAWSTAEIVSAPLLALWVFGEIPAPTKVVGGVIVIFGLLYYNFHECDTPGKRNKV